MDKVYLTRDGLQKLEGELRQWKTKRLPEMLKQVAEAREHGDLSENAEYHAAREELTRIHAKIYQLEQTLFNVHLVDENSIDTDQVRILTTVRIQDHSKNQQRQYTLVALEEADPTIGKISVQSPVGRGLIGKKAGDRVTIQVPAGKVEWTILEILPLRTKGGSDNGNSTAT